jgi:hypothetical protein
MTTVIVMTKVIGFTQGMCSRIFSLRHFSLHPDLKPLLA